MKGPLRFLGGGIGGYLNFVGNKRQWGRETESRLMPSTARVVAVGS